jgi:cation transport ATPase
LGQAILAQALGRNIALGEPEDFNAIPGHGIRATVDDRAVLLGNLKLMQQSGVDVGDLSGVVTAIHLSKRTMRTIQQTLYPSERARKPRPYGFGKTHTQPLRT